VLIGAQLHADWLPADIFRDEGGYAVWTRPWRARPLGAIR
jgi:hypothetical protein